MKYGDFPRQQAHSVPRQVKATSTALYHAFFELRRMCLVTHVWHIPQIVGVDNQQPRIVPDSLNVPIGSDLPSLTS